MIIYFMNRDTSIVGVASTERNSKYIIISDTKKEDVDTNASSFECMIMFDKEHRIEVTELISAGGWLLLGDDIAVDNSKLKDVSTSSNNLFAITETELNISDMTMSVYSEGSSLDLLNDISGVFNNSEPFTIEEYLDKFLSDTDYNVNIMDAELEEETKILSFDDATTITERLNSVASSFECELEFGVSIKGLDIRGFWINVYKERGVDNNINLYLNKHIKNITVKSNINNLATALIPTGSDSLTLLDLANPDSYDDENYYIDGVYLKSRDALSKWDRFHIKNTLNGDIIRTFSYETNNPVELYNKALDELKKRVEPEINYEVDIIELPNNVRIGDRVNIIDDAGELYLSSRILQLESSVVSNTRTATLGEFKIKDSGMSDKLLTIAKSFSSVASNQQFYLWIMYANKIGNSIKQLSRINTGQTHMGLLPNKNVELTSDSQLTSEAIVNTQWSEVTKIRITIESTNGLTYKNGTINTTLNATVHFGNTEIKTLSALHDLFGESASLKWYKKGVEIAGATGFSYVVSGEQETIGTIYNCKLIGIGGI